MEIFIFNSKPSFLHTICYIFKGTFIPDGYCNSYVNLFLRFFSLHLVHCSTKIKNRNNFENYEKNSIKKSCIKENFRTVQDGFAHFYQKKGSFVCPLVKAELTFEFVFSCLY